MEDELEQYIDGISDIKSDTGDDNVTTEGGDNVQGAEGQQELPLQQPNGTVDQQATSTSTQNKGDTNSGLATKPQADGTKGQQPQQGDKDAANKQLRPLGDGTFADKQGNIVDEKGNVLAERGFAARIYNQNRRMKEQLTERTQQLNELHQAVGEVRALATSIQQYGLSNDEVASAMDLAGRMKRGDHLGVAKEVLAMIVAQGYNVTDLLGKDVGDSIETRAIQRMIDERLAPITRLEQSRQQETEAQRQGRMAYDQFVADNEYADVHADDIVKIMQEHNLKPQAAYNRLYQFAARNGLDFSQPIGPQIQARVQQQTQVQQRPAQQQVQQQQRSNGRPMPNGASTRMTGATATMPLASADDDWGSIISEVQRTIGGQH